MNSNSIQDHGAVVVGGSSVLLDLADTNFVKALGKKWCDEQTPHTPLKRLAGTDEIGAAMLAVVAHPDYSAGCIIAIDGGRSLA